ncbi:MAG: Fic family protein [Betaproteobacteria bacterium]
MKPQTIQQYDSPHQFEPLMPAEPLLAPLLEKASDLMRKATAFGAASGKTAQSELRKLLRSMNSYYTNRIEGEHTRPSDIERALQQDFSANADLARKQRLAVAHIRTEALCEGEVDRRLQTEGPEAVRWLYSPEALTWLHQELFRDLPEEDLRLADGSTMVPGELRQRGVAVGRHEAPTAQSLPRFIERWQQVYGGVRRGEASIVALAAAHHRLAWTHPFLDGNGRVTRLHTHLLLQAGGLTGGLWSPLRGFARTEARYKALLQAADEHRHGDLDGRGNLTQAGLVQWIEYTLDICIDQVEFMARQLEVQGMQDRIRAALSYEASAVKSGVREEALLPLHYLFVTQGELGRASFKAMTGLGERVATTTVSALLSRGFVTTDSPYGSLRFAIPRHALRFYFPALWPEAEQDQALVEGEIGAAPAPRAAPRRGPHR